MMVEYEEEIQSELDDPITKKRGNRLSRSISARLSRKKSKAIKKIRSLKREAEGIRILNKDIGK